MLSAAQVPTASCKQWAAVCNSERAIRSARVLCSSKVQDQQGGTRLDRRQLLSLLATVGLSTAVAYPAQAAFSVTKAKAAEQRKEAREAAMKEKMAKLRAEGNGK